MKILHIDTHTVYIAVCTTNDGQLLKFEVPEEVAQKMAKELLLGPKSENVNDTRKVDMPPIPKPVMSQSPPTIEKQMAEVGYMYQNDGGFDGLAEEQTENTVPPEDIGPEGVPQL